MKAVSAIALVFASVLTWGQEAPREPRLNNLDNDIAAHADVPGLAVAVTRDGKIIYEGGFGWADCERGLRATPNTPVTLASVSKSITATATMQLSERGSLNLDTPVNDYVGYARVRSPHWNPAESTVRRVMSHTLVDSPLSPAGAALIIPPAISMGRSATTASWSGVRGSSSIIRTSASASSATSSRECWGTTTTPH